MTRDGITVCHVHQDAGRFDVWGARHNGFGMEYYDIGQKGWLGNPFTTDHHDRRTAVLLFAGAFDVRRQRDSEFKHAVEDLDGKAVACYCRPWTEDTPLCHLDVVDYALRGDLDLLVDHIEAGGDELEAFLARRGSD